MSVDNYTITKDTNHPNPTVLTMLIRNAGTTTAALSTLFIKDSSGNSLATFPMNGQTIAPRGGVTTVTIDTLSSGFHFTGGYGYTIMITTLLAFNSASSRPTHSQ